MALWAVYVLFLLSGISGLIYQVVWVREFGAVFGNTVYSAAAVTAVFMCGLGFGGFFVGQRSDRRHGDARRLPLRAYGFFEIGIALLGLAVAFVLPELEELSARFSRYEIGPGGWFELTTASHGFRYAAAVLLLAPITFLMGGTLTLLIRYVVAADLRATGVRVGVLYGMNTAGAALGAFATDFFLIPGFGILAAEGVAIALNLVAGVGALALAARGRAGAEDERRLPEPLPTTKDDGPGPFLVGRTAATLFVTGFVAMGFEIVWFRYLISGLGARRSTFSLLMVVILVGIFLGSVIGGLLERRLGQPVRLFMAAQVGFIVVALAPMFLLGTQLVVPFADPSVLEEVRPSLQGLAEIGINLPHIVAVVGLAALLMGCTFPLANAHVQRIADSVGGRAGALYLATTLGNVAGSVLTGFVLLPALGQQGSIALLTACIPLGLVPLYLSARSARAPGREVSGRFFAACIAVLLLCLGGWLALPQHYLLKHARMDADTYVPQRVVAVSEGINESVLVIERSDGRVLYTHGHPMSATIFPAQRYMRLFAHFPLLSAEEPRRVLVICFGVGNTLHAASMHPGIEELDIVDLSRNVLEHGSFFSDTNGNILEDDRVSVYVNDGRQHLRMQAPGSYDLITLEPPPIDHAGVASLYTKEFYELARSRLREGGFMTQWLPAYQVSTGMTLSIIRSFLEVFPDAALLSGYKRELILVGSNSAASHLDVARVREALAENVRVAEDLQGIAAGSLVDLAAAFVAGPAALEAATRGVRPVTDDLPAMEYEPKALRFGTRLPVEIFDASELRDWCKGCFEGDRPIAELAELPQLMEILEQYHRSEMFLDFPRRSVNAAEQDPPPLAGQPCGLRAVRESVYFAGIFGCRPAR